jgi:hypothetical protein
MSLFILYLVNLVNALVVVFLDMTISVLNEKNTTCIFQYNSFIFHLHLNLHLICAR